MPLKTRSVFIQLCGPMYCTVQSQSMNYKAVKLVPQDKLLADFGDVVLLSFIGTLLSGLKSNQQNQILISYIFALQLQACPELSDWFFFALRTEYVERITMIEQQEIVALIKLDNNFPNFPLTLIALSCTELSIIRVNWENDFLRLSF